MLDASGNVIIDSASEVARTGNFADRRYFTVQRDNPNAGLYISDPYQSRLRDGSPSIAMSRRISHPDGSFAGIALIAINLDYFHRLFAGLSLGPHGAISLIGKNGIMVMRQPYDVRTVGRDFSKASTFRRFSTAAEGSFPETASIDGVRRLYYFRNFPDLPLIIMVAEAEQDIYAAWRRRAITIGSLMAAFALGFVGLSFLLGAQLRRRMRAESELELLAKTDGLTGLHNRRTLGEILEQEWRRARRTRSMFSFYSSTSTGSRHTTTHMVTRPGMTRSQPWQGASATISGGRPTAQRVTAAKNSSSSCPIPRPRVQARLPSRSAARSARSRSSMRAANTGA